MESIKNRKRGIRRAKMGYFSRILQKERKKKIINV